MRRANWILGAVVVVILVPVLYLVSLGPAFGLHCRGVISMKAYTQYSRPLYLVAPADSSFGHAMQWYIDRWV